MRKIGIFILCLVLRTACLSQQIYQIVAAGNFFDLEQKQSNPEEITIQLNLSLQWVSGERIYNDSLATIPGNLYSLLSKDKAYIFYINTSNSVPNIVSILPLTDILARTTLDDLGPPDFAPPREGLQVYPIFGGWFWSQNFGLYRIIESAGESSRGLGYHDQLGWMYILSEGFNRADWDVWLWHYQTQDWYYVDFFSYPWMYSVTDGWLYLLQENDPFVIWLFFYTTNVWKSIERR